MLTDESVQMSVMLKDYYDSMEKAQNSVDLEEGLTHMEIEILVDEMEKIGAEVSSYTNTDVDEDIADTQEARNANFTSTSSNITPGQDYSNPDQEVSYSDDNYNFWNFPPDMTF
ncbi:unnamed protein product [Lactuca virosa]|uniref:Uncharacterized protein n=1 Tax=Lactuca virosa TaxID=75947 RepID=A0AAU9PRZ5_9ASTR|nr:unnamed protein product [Lactuca virosa]